MRKNNKTISALLILMMMIFITSCSSEMDDVLQGEDDISSQLEEINSFSLDEVQRMKAELESQGIEVPDILLTEEDEEPTTRGIFLDNPFVKAIKVSTKSLHPDRSGEYIDVSGVLLVPRKTLLTSLKSFKIVVVPPPTYTSNASAPSIAFQKMSLVGKDWDLNFLYFWTLQAQSGCVVFIPDYPGYGDSHGKCFHPYLDAESLVNSTIDLLKAAQKTLSANGYRYKSDLAISGYSQGGFVAALLAREIETNPKHNLSVNLLVTGGTPCNLKDIADAVRHSDYLQDSYFLPFGLWGYKENAYPDLKVSDFLLEPYASESKSYYDGTHSNLSEYFPHEPNKVYTEKFLKYMDIDPDMAYINQILDENSVKPWKNKCRFVMTHGMADVSVYYQNAKDFAEAHKDAGGKVTFYPTIGDHVVGFLPYYSKATFYILLYK